MIQLKDRGLRIAFSRLCLAAAILIALAFPLTAGSVVLYDYCYDTRVPGGKTNCAASGTQASAWQERDTKNYSGKSDVIGALGKFDIDYLSFTVSGSSVTVKASYRYNGGSVDDSSIGEPGPDSINYYDAFSARFYTGDILFSTTTPTDSTNYDTYQGANWKYGIKIGTDTRALATGLYSISGVQYSQTTFVNGTLQFRQFTPVWFDTAGAAALDNTAPITVDPTAPPDDEYRVSITVDNAAFVSDLYRGMYVTFASATCGNDIIYGQVAVPEPGAFLLMGAVVGALAIGVRRRRKTA